MCLCNALSRLIKLVCLTAFLTTSLVSQAQAGQGGSKGWGKGGKKQTTETAPTNTAPTISGVPASSVSAGSDYVFRPNASDADGDSLTFSVSNRPSWASFNSSTGRLSGTPGNSHVGTYDNIRVTVSDGSSNASVGPFSITVVGITVIESNDAPTIFGSPDTSVAVDSFYDFRPVADDPDGDSLSFSIKNRPAWARFSSSTGRLAGQPAAGDVGNYSDIRISVSDGTVTTSMPAFSVTVNSTAAQTEEGAVSLSWVAPTSRADGTPLPLSELAGYTLYYGSSPDNYTDSINVDDPYTTSLTVTELPVGTYYFVVTARDVTGDESDYSGVVSKQAN